MTQPSSAASTQSHVAAPTPSAVSRQIVGFSFYRLDPAWRRVPRATKNRHTGELLGLVTAQAKKLMVMTYSLIGLKAEADFLIWRVGKSLEELNQMSSAVRQTALAGYLTVPYQYLSMTKRSSYVDKLDPDHADKRRFITPFHSKYLFVYPFWKTWEWYALPSPSGR